MITQKDVQSVLKQISQAASPKELERLRIRYLGRRGSLTKVLRSIGELPPERRSSQGRRANQWRNQLETAIQARTEVLISAVDQTDDSPLDLTAPAPGPKIGHLHPVEELQKEMLEIFRQLGFVIANGPEIETDWYNFEALNIPSGHPARDMQDSFYLDNGMVARTHTSSVQIRYMESHTPPIRIVAQGNVYRNEDEDATHLWAFKQLECLVVDEGVSLADLKGTLLFMFKALLGMETKISLRPSYFPYVEPALEVHISCPICKGKDAACRTCRGTGWLEMLGAGMVHPQVLKNVGIDDSRYSGFAFGGGLERIAAVRHGVPDIREFWRPNLNFLEQF